MNRSTELPEFRLFNTASREVEPVRPLEPPEVKMYVCGITAYYYAHIGHARAYVNSDTLRRALELFGYRVRQVMNVTDVGHMTSDEDAGEDKLEVRARKEKKSPWEIAKYYEADFFDSMERMNILAPDVVCRATEHIPEMVGLAEILEEKGYTYETDVGLIYDTEKFERYADFARLNLEEQRAGARTQVDEQRKNPWDFALWVSNQPNHIMQWDSPWGRGFPGWHLECSAMSKKYLGEQIDIHTGGIDHIPIHHTNEIAQSEGASGKQFVRHWMHTEFLRLDGRKMSKSLGNLYTLDDLEERGFTPLALRYFFLGASYRKSLNFTWEALAAAQKALVRLWTRAAAQPEPAPGSDVEPIEEFRDRFLAALAHDLNTSEALAVVNELAAREPSPEVAATLAWMDQVLGLDLAEAQARLDALEALQRQRAEAEQDISEEALQEMVERRERLRAEKKFGEADAVRDALKELGFAVEDGPEGPTLRPLGPTTD